VVYSPYPQILQYQCASLLQGFDLLQARLDMIEINSCLSLAQPENSGLCPDLC
jgi:hypothetical protein